MWPVARWWNEGGRPGCIVPGQPRKYIDGHGNVLVGVHERSPRCDLGCVIHSPTDRTGFPTLFRRDRLLVERVCPHGVGHPDVDHLRYVAWAYDRDKAKAEAVHGCDGCCSPNWELLAEAIRNGSEGIPVMDAAEMSGCPGCGKYTCQGECLDDSWGPDVTQF